MLSETWPSGRRHAPAKGASGQNLDPGFESLRLRQNVKTRTPQGCAGFLLLCQVNPGQLGFPDFSSFGDNNCPRIVLVVPCSYPRFPPPFCLRAASSAVAAKELRLCSDGDHELAEARCPGRNRQVRDTGGLEFRELHRRRFDEQAVACEVDSAESPSHRMPATDD